MFDLIIASAIETICMVLASTILTVLIGLPLGTLLSIYDNSKLYKNKFAYNFLSIFINTIRSIPYIILVVLLIPFTRFLVGSSIGTVAAIVPLSLAGALLFARISEEAFRQVNPGLIEMGLSHGATKWQVVRSILFTEALPTLVAGLTTVTINLIGFSAMAGAVGGGGLGDLAIRYGYQRYDLPFLTLIVTILIGFVQLVQMFGDWYVKRLEK